MGIHCRVFVEIYRLAFVGIDRWTLVRNDSLANGTPRRTHRTVDQPWDTTFSQRWPDHFVVLRYSGILKTFCLLTLFTIVFVLPLQHTTTSSYRTTQSCYITEKRCRFQIRKCIPFQCIYGSHTTALIQGGKSAVQLWSNLPAVQTCNYYMFGLLNEAFGCQSRSLSAIGQNRPFII